MLRRIAPIGGITDSDRACAACSIRRFGEAGVNQAHGCSRFIEEGDRARAVDEFLTAVFAPGYRRILDLISA
jgi:hypothetical protein